MTISPAGPGRDRPLADWAAATWRSLDAMTHPATGLPSDGIDRTLRPESRTGYTSPTNIGGLLWSTVVAAELGLLSSDEARTRIGITVRTIDGLRRHAPSGLFYNWYDPATGERLDVFPVSGDRIAQFLSSVDNGWLVAGLQVAARWAQQGGAPDLAARTARLGASVDLGSCYDRDARLLRGGFWDDDPAPAGSVTTPLPGHLDAAPVHMTGHHYGLLNSEPRITSYLGIVRGRIAAEHYAAMRRGRVEYAGTTLVPTHGGSMFEALMPDLFVPESDWAPRGFAHNHPATVAAQRHFGMVDTGYGSWGFSPASVPAAPGEPVGYSEWGVEPIAELDGGYPSDTERTTVSRAAGTGWGDGVVTPHALFLALRYDRPGVIAALDDLAVRFDAVGPGGFVDAVAVRSGERADVHLSLDQSMVLAALGNELADDLLRRLFVDDDTARILRPLLAADHFPGADSAPNGSPDTDTDTDTPATSLESIR